MGVIADMIRAGVDPDLIERVHLEMVEVAKPAATMTARQARNARYYEKKASEKRLKASEPSNSDDQDAGVLPAHPADGVVYNHARADGIPAVSSLRSETDSSKKNKQKNPSPDTKPNNEPAHLLAEFEGDFWATWMRLTRHSREKKPACAEFVRARKAGHSLETILAGVANYAKTKPEWQSWQAPNRWLKAERFLDAPAPEPCARAGPSQSRGGFAQLYAECLENELEQRIEKEIPAENVRLLPFGPDDRPETGGGDGDGVSRQRIELLVGSSFRRM